MSTVVAFFKSFLLKLLMNRFSAKNKRYILLSTLTAKLGKYYTLPQRELQYRLHQLFLTEQGEGGTQALTSWADFFLPGFDPNAQLEKHNVDLCKVLQGDDTSRADLQRATNAIMDQLPDNILYDTRPKVRKELTRVLESFQPPVCPISTKGKHHEHA